MTATPFSFCRFIMHKWCTGRRCRARGRRSVMNTVGGSDSSPPAPSSRCRGETPPGGGDARRVRELSTTHLPALRKLRSETGLAPAVGSVASCCRQVMLPKRRPMPSPSSGTKESDTPARRSPWSSRSSSRGRRLLQIGEGAGLHRLQPRKGLQSSLPAPGDAGDAEDLPGVGREADVASFRSRRSADVEAPTSMLARVFRRRPVDVQETAWRPSCSSSLSSCPLSSMSPTKLPLRSMRRGRRAPPPSCILCVMMTMAFPSRASAQDGKEVPLLRGQHGGGLDEMRMSPRGTAP